MAKQLLVQLGVALLAVVIITVLGALWNAATDGRLVQMLGGASSDTEEATRQLGSVVESHAGRLSAIEGRLIAGQSLVCETVEAVGRIAVCPQGYVVTGCSAGGNRGSIDHFDDRCVTHNLDTDWTEARCCKVE